MRLDKLEIRWLKLFCKIVEKRGITNAENATGLSQPVLSHYLSRLEEALGLVLCERGRGGFALTTEGKLVYQEALRLIATLDDFAHQLAGIKDQLVGEARIGCLDNIATHPAQVLPLSLDQLYRQNANAKVELRIGDYDPLMEQLKNGTLDMVLSVLPENLPANILSHPAFIEHSFFYAHPRLAEQVEHQWRTGTLDPRRLLVGGYALHDYYQLLGPIAKQGLQNASWHVESSLLLLLAGTHVGFLPDHYAHSWVSQGKLCAIAPESLLLTSTFYLTRYAKHRLSPVAEALWNNILSISQQSDHAAQQ